MSRDTTFILYSIEYRSMDGLNEIQIGSTDIAFHFQRMILNYTSNVPMKEIKILTLEKSLSKP